MCIGSALLCTNLFDSILTLASEDPIASVRGTMQGNVYINEKYGLQITVPSDWYYLDEAALQEQTVIMNEGNPGLPSYLDLYVYDAETGNNILLSVMEVPEKDYLNPQDYYDEFEKNKRSFDEVVQDTAQLDEDAYYSGLEEVVLFGNQTECVFTTYMVNGEPCYQWQIAFCYPGYLALLVASSFDEDKTQKLVNYVERYGESSATEDINLEERVDASSMVNSFTTTVTLGKGPVKFEVDLVEYNFFR